MPITVPLIDGATIPPQHPVTYRIPKSAKPARPARNGKPARPANPPECDPYFGFSRSFYFTGEKRGYWTLLRICEPGKDRGVTLVEYDQVAAFVASQRKMQNEQHAEVVVNGGDTGEKPGGQHFARSPKYYEQQQKKEQQKHHPKLGTLS